MLKKFGFLITALSASLLVGLSLGNAKQEYSPALATDPWQEEVSAEDILIKYAKAVVDDEEADYVTVASGRFSYFVRHGFLSSSTIEKYETVTGDGTTTCGYDYTTGVVDSKRAYVIGNTADASNGTKLLLKKNTDGVILGITAHEAMTCTAPEVTFKGWFNSWVYVDSFVKRSGSNSYTSIQSKKIATGEETYSQEAVTIYNGDTIYFQIYHKYGNGDVKQTEGSGLPTFTLDEYKIERTIKTTEMARTYYNNALASNADADFVRDESQVFEYGVRHGKIEANNVVKFDSVTKENSNITYAIASDTGNVYAGITYGKNIWTLNDDGVIFVIRALEEVTFKSVALTYAGGWQDGIYITYAIKNNGASYYTVVAKEYYKTANGDTAAVAPITLRTGDQMFFEFRSAATTGGRRSIQDNSDTGNVPTFVVSKKDVGSVSVEANTFMAKYMKLATVSGNGTGLCITQNWYANAKTAFNAISDDARELFLTNAAYTEGADRLRAWATANGDEVDGSYLLVSSGKITVFNEIINNDNSMIIFAIIFGTFASLSLLVFFINKMLHNK